MSEIKIKYCVPCGLLQNAIETQQTLLETYGQDIEGVTLKPGHGGIFKVRVDGELVFDKDEDGGYDLNAIREAIQSRIEAPA